MALANYSDLVTAIGDWMMDRSDLASAAPDMIVQGEAIINYGTELIAPLRCRDMETVVSITPSSGVAAIPPDYLQYRRVVDKGSPRRSLDFITPDGADLYYPDRSSGISNHFTIIGSSLYTFPLTTNDVELTYYAAVPALTASATTNWLMTKRPDIYLRASLMQAAEYIKDDEETAKQAQFLASLISGMNKADMLANYARGNIMPRRAVA